jgi:hypothetical protein
MELAPIVLFVYNRPEHTRRTLAALQKNHLADRSQLFIFADGAKTNATQEQINKINEVRAICIEQKWCGEVKLIKADSNKGLAKSVIEGVTQIINQFGKVIVLEDDIETMSEFLIFMNKGLDHYQRNSAVGGITGFSFDENKKLDPFFFLPIASSWSWATWKRVWDKFEPSSEKILKEILERNKINEFNFANYPYTKMLEDQINGLVDSWAIRFYGTVFLQNQYFLFPRITLVTNIGFDNSGTHCDDINPFEYNLNGEKTNFEFPEVIVKNKNVKIIKNAFQLKLLKGKKQSKLNKLSSKIKDSVKWRLTKLFKIN